MPKRNKTGERNKNTRMKRQSNRVKQYEIKEPTEVLPFLLETITGTSRNSIKSILTRGQVTVDGKVITKHNHELKFGSIVIIQGNHAAIKEKALIGIEVIYEDEDLIIIEKEAGMLSISTNNKTELTAYSQLKQYVKKDNPQNKLFIVHRLDRDTSGVMVFAKNEQTKKRLQDNWKELVFERSYNALVEGEVKKQSDSIISWLTESKTFKSHSCPFDNGGKKAITHYKKIRGNKQFSLMEVNLDTGRKNQIRVHMQELGHPIVGDKKYGASSNPIKRLGLHATSLGFKHPTSGEKMTFKSKKPKLFLTLSANKKEE